jgi:hypothetical protein
MKNNFVRYPSPGASHHPLPSGEGLTLFPPFCEIIAGNISS